MSLTTRIRFTEPVDPREVWNKIMGLINTPDDYQWSHVPVGGNPIAWNSPLIYAEPGQGADVWVYVMYGPDGCRLVEDEDANDPPPAFVEVTLIGDWSTVDIHAAVTDELARWRPIWTSDDYSEGWWPTESVNA